MITSESAVHPGLRLGLRPTDQARQARLLRMPIKAIPKHPMAADHITAVGDGWTMGGNDRFGTCGPTMIANFAILQYLVLTGEIITVTDEAVFDLYRRAGNPGFDPATGADDNGVEMMALLGALLSGGIDITRADGTVENIKPLCYAGLPLAADMQRAITDVFGGALWAVDLHTAQQGQTDSGLWDYVAHTGEWGGHAIVGGKYSSDTAPHHADITVVTWARPVGTTDAFELHQLQESYVAVFPVLWDSPGFDAAVDRAALAADYESATGRPFPVPVPQPADAADALWAVAGPWTKEHHSSKENVRLKTALLAWADAEGLT